MSTSTTGNDGPQIEIDVDLDEGSAVAVVTFSRGTHNYFNYELLDRLATTLEGLPSTGARAVVLRTTSRYFCVGADFIGQRGSGTAGPHVYDAVPRLVRAPLPLVAEVGGAAIGGGLGLALVADFRVASTSAYFLANFARLGISQGFALSATLPRLVGPQFSTEMIYTAKRVAGEEALRVGLCDRLVEPEDLHRTAVDFAAEIAKSAPLVVASARRTLRADLMDGIEDVLAHERFEQQPLKATEDFREGNLAWREKRPPRFRGL